MLMEELRPAESFTGSSAHVVAGCDLSSDIAAAAAMQCYTSETSLGKTPQPGDSGDLNGYGYHSDVGALARVVFKFQHRPEWLLQGSKVIMRDRTDGCIAGAGVIHVVQLD